MLRPEEGVEFRRDTGVGSVLLTQVSASFVQWLPPFGRSCRCPTPASQPEAAPVGLAGAEVERVAARVVGICGERAERSCARCRR